MLQAQPPVVTISNGTFSGARDCLDKSSSFDDPDPDGLLIVRMRHTGPNPAPDSTTWTFRVGGVVDKVVETTGSQEASAALERTGNVVVEVTGYYGGVASTISEPLGRLYDIPTFDFNVVSGAAGCSPLTTTFNFTPGAGFTVGNIFIDFGDGAGVGQNSAANISHIYNLNNTQGADPFVTFTDINGCSHSFRKNDLVTVYKTPSPDFSVTSGAGCAGGLQVQFINETTPLNGNSYTWDFGDGNTSNDLSPAHTYGANNRYDVKLTAVSDAGTAAGFNCIDDTTLNDVVNLSAFETNLSIRSTGPCAPAQFTFEDSSSTGDIGSYSIDFGNGQTQNGGGPMAQTLPIEYTEGSYTVTYIARASNGCTDTFTYNFTIDPAPDASFTLGADDVVECAFPHTIMPTNTSMGATSFEWNWGDGSGYQSTNSLTEIHTYNGTPAQLDQFYPLELVALNGTSCTDTFRLDSAIYIGTPIVQFNIIDIEPCINVSTGQDKVVSYSIQNIILPTGASVDNIAWTFDAAVASPPSATGFGPIVVNYDAEGEFDVEVDIDYTGCANNTIDTIVTGVAPEPTGFSGTIDLDTICPDEEVAGEITSGSIDYQYTWDHGDGMTTIVPKGVGPGTSTWGYDPQENPYTVFLEADDFGCKSVIQIDDVVVKFPIMYFTDTAACLFQPANRTEFLFTPTDTLFGGLQDVTWRWDFNGFETRTRSLAAGDDPLATEIFDFAPYLNADGEGTFTVSLFTSSVTSGCMDIPHIQIVQVVAPAPKFSIDTFALEDCFAGSDPYIVTFRDSTDVVDQWFWDFDDGTTNIAIRNNALGITGSYVEHPYQNSGTYYPKLTVTDINGCQQTYRVGTIKINKLVSGAVIPLGVCPDISNSVTLTDTTFVEDNPGSATVNWWVDGSLVASGGLGTPATFPVAGEDTFLVSFAVRAGFCYDSIPPRSVFSRIARAGFKIEPEIGCPGIPIQFIDTSFAVRVDRYSWDFGDPDATNDTSNLDKPTYVYSKPGTYNVSLKIFDETGCNSDTIIPFEVREFSVSFTQDANFAQCPELRVNFALVEDTIAVKDIFWNFNWDDDPARRALIGSESYNSEGIIDPLWTYDGGGFRDATGKIIGLDAGVDASTVGYYDVYLSVTDSSGCTDDTLGNIAVFVGGANGNFTLSPDTICIPADVTFNDFVNADKKTYLWGNNTQSPTINVIPGPDVVVNTYDKLDNNLYGFAFPELLLEDDDCPSVVRRTADTIWMSDMRTVVPTPLDTLCDSVTTIFRDSTILLGTAPWRIEPNDRILSSVWQVLGDPSAGATDVDSFQYTFDSSGVYTVILTNKSLFGCEDADSLSVAILQTPTLILPDDVVCLGNPKTLDIENDTVAANWVWTDSSTILNPRTSNPTFFIVDTTTYYVSFTDTSGNCPNMDTVTIRPIENLNARVEPDIDICLGDTLQLRAASNLDNTGSARFSTFVWTLTPPGSYIDDTTIESPRVAPTDRTEYKVVLTNPSVGCDPDSGTAVIDVGSPPVVRAGEDKTIIRGETTTIDASSNLFDAYVWTPDQYLDNPNIARPNATPPQTTRFYVTVQDGPCEAVDSLMVFVLDGCIGDIVFVPNAFTPNGDGKNDVLKIFNNYAQEDPDGISVFRIYNRWGEKVYEGTDFTSEWDGTYNGQPVDPGVYVFYIEAICTNGEKGIVKGNVTLLR